MSHSKDVTTTDGEVFTHEQACQMAELVYFRFGKNLRAAAEAWSRMMQNDTSPAQFAGLLDDNIGYKFAGVISRYSQWWQERGRHIVSGNPDHVDA